jgi:phage antirepressor YoqD-like protein
MVWDGEVAKQIKVQAANLIKYLVKLESMYS